MEGSSDDLVIAGRRVRSHALRQPLTDELHSRPFMTLGAPARVSYLAVTAGTRAEDGAQLQSLLAALGAAPAPAEANHHAAEFDGFGLKWEKHSEFASYSFHATAAATHRFADAVIGAIPAGWLAALDGRIIVAAHVEVEKAAESAIDIDGILRDFAGNPLYGSRVVGGGGSAFTDFRIHGDGFSRFLLVDHDLRERQAGRLVQRLLEIETYRNMALLALPLARAGGGEVDRLERALAEITAAMPAMDGAEGEGALLERLTQLSAEIEGLAARNSYRFGAANAYSALVGRRIAELRESRIEGIATLSEFMDRRFAPAMATCATVAQRQDQLATRIARATQLLRTRVELALEGQNRDVLRSMDRRAHLQLRLQETVEGLSTVAITYYLLGLLGHLLGAVNAAGFHVESELVLGTALPFLLALVWIGVRRLRRALMPREPRGEASPQRK
jgi:uncharacterized membrane-anchored protein